MSILSVPYDEEAAKRVYAREYAQEQVEDDRMERAKEMLLDGEPLEKIVRYTKLSLEIIEKIKHSM